MDAFLSDFLDIPPETPTSARPFDFDGSWPQASTADRVGAVGWELAAGAVDNDDDAFGFASSGSQDDTDVWLAHSTGDGLSSCGIELGEIAPLPGFTPPPQPISSSANFPYASQGNAASKPYAPTPADFLTHNSSPYGSSTGFAPPPPPASTSSRSFDSPSPSSASSASLPPATPPSGWTAGSALTSATLADDGTGPALKRARSEDSDASTVNGGGSVDPYALFLTPGAGAVAAEGWASPPSAPASTSSASFATTAAAKPPAAKKELTGTGKKRKSLPTVAEFQQPSTDGLSKKEARLVKNRAAAFLSRQRKREMYDELEIEVGKLRTELAQLKDNAPPPAVSSTPMVELAAVKADLAHVRSLLHASTARERALEVELASLRARHGPSAASSAGAVLPLAHAAIQPLHQQVGPGPMVSGFGADDAAAHGRMQPAHTAGRRTVGAGADRDSKRIGGVALMVIMFSFALFSFPSTALSSLPLRLTPTHGAGGSSSPFPAFLGRVLSASTGAAGGAPRFANVTIAKDTGGGPICLARDKSKLKASEAELQPPANATEPAANEQMECDASSSAPASPSAASDGTAGARDLAWPLPHVNDQQATARRSLSLTLLRPVPASVAELADRDETGRDDDVDDVLSRWLGLSLDDATAAAVAGDFGLLQTSSAGLSSTAGHSVHRKQSTTASSGPDAGGWLLIGPGQSVDIHRLAGTNSATAVSAGSDVKAWDGSTLERMELDDVLSPGSAASDAALPSLAASDADVALAPANPDSDDPRPVKPLYRRSSAAQPPHLYSLGSPPPGPSLPAGSLATAGAGDGNTTSSEPSSGQYLRLDLSLDLSVRKTAAAFIGADELGRLLALSAPSGSSAGAGGASLAHFGDGLALGLNSLG